MYLVIHASSALRLLVTEVRSLTAVSDPKVGVAVLLQDATPKGRAARNILVLHVFSTHPEPLITQETQARPHQPTF